MPTRCSRMDPNCDAYSVLNLHVVCIVGGRNSNEYGTNRVLHHTIGLPDFSQELRGFQAITYY
jgi:pyruvate decarboxylase